MNDESFENMVGKLDRTPGLMASISEQVEYLAMLHQSIDELEKALGPVLENETSTGAKLGSEPSAPGSVAVTQIKGNNNGITAATRKVRGIIGKLTI